MAAGCEVAGAILQAMPALVMVILEEAMTLARMPSPAKLPAREMTTARQNESNRTAWRLPL